MQRGQRDGVEFKAATLCNEKGEIAGIVEAQINGEVGKAKKWY